MPFRIQSSQDVVLHCHGCFSNILSLISDVFEPVEPLTITLSLWCRAYFHICLRSALTCVCFFNLRCCWTKLAECSFSDCTEQHGLEGKTIAYPMANLNMLPQMGLQHSHHNTRLLHKVKKISCRWMWI